ncbi:MAG: ATP-binding protein [Spirochaetes bacterium]|nr:MAG: ATP-binding protein [Spirochaetota bacterium]
MEDISLHILDIAENSINAGATSVDVEIEEDQRNDLLTVKISDNGKGMDEDMIKKAADPFYTTKPGKRVGLGLSLFAHSAREAGGELKVISTREGGTVVTATFNMSHPDRKPLGNVQETMDVLKASHPEIEFKFKHTRF